MAENPHESIACYEAVPGGREVLAWFGALPTFGDSEILSLHLNRKGASVLRLYAMRLADGVRHHAIVTFSLEGISHLALEDFSHQNVIGGLILRRGPRQPDYRPQFWHAPPEPDFEIELEPCFGLEGIIRAKSIRIDLAPINEPPNEE